MISRVLKFLKLDILLRPLKPVGGWLLRVLPNMITCREFNDLIYDHVEGDLPEKQTTLVNRHVSACPICRSFLKTYIASHEARNHIVPYETIEVPDTVPQELTDAILDVRATKDT